MSGRFRRAWRSLLRREDVERAVDEELAFHREMVTRELMDQEGLSEEEARAEAERRFGELWSYEQECLRIGERRRKRRRRLLWARDLRSDLRFALRSLKRRPLILGVAVLSLAVGIGVTVTVFALGNTFLFRPAGYLEEPREIVTIYAETSTEQPHGPVSFPDYRDIAAQVDALESVAVMGLDAVRGGERLGGRSLLAEVVTGNYFQVTGIRPVIGRAFQPDETPPGSAVPVALLSHRLWKEQFGGQTSVLGSEIRLNGVPITVIGVCPPGITSRMVPVRVDLWMPLGIPGAGTRRVLSELDQRGDRQYQVIGRLAEGADIRDVQAQTDVLAARLASGHPELWQIGEGQPRGFRVVSEEDSRVNPDARTGLAGLSALLLGFTGLVLLIACFNVAGVFLARAGGRRREIALRRSLGASRGRVVRLLLVESLVPGLLSGALGTLLALGLTRLLSSLTLEFGVPLQMDLSVDGRVLLFAVVLSTAVSMLFGLAPALEGARISLVPAIRGLSGDESGRPTRVRRVLIALQVTGATLFLAATGLFLRSSLEAGDADLGFDPSGLAVVSHSMSHLQAEGGDVRRLVRDRLAELRSRGDLEGAAAAVGVELTTTFMVRSGNTEVADAGRPEADRWRALHNAVTGEYMETMGFRLLRGRTLKASDREGTRPVAVVNETFAARMWPGADPVGRDFQVWYGRDPEHTYEEDHRTLTVVGVVGDGKYLAIGEDRRSVFWTSFYQDPADHVTFVARGRDSAAQAAGILGRVVEIPRGELSLVPPSTMEAALSRQFVYLRMSSRILGACGIFALVLTLIGIYGLVSYTAALGRKEIAVRQALGAGPGQVLRWVVRSGIRVTASGLAVGIVLALLLGQAVRSLLYGTRPLDPLVMGGSSVLVLVAALTAALAPALRATRTDPMSVLRDE